MYKQAYNEMIVCFWKKFLLQKREETYEDPFTSYTVISVWAHLHRKKCCGSCCRHVSAHVRWKRHVYHIVHSNPGNFCKRFNL